MKEKIEKAVEALYSGDQELASTLFTDAVAEGASDMANRIAADVHQQQLQDRAVAKLFEDYPEIKADSGYATLVDRAARAHLANGEPIDQAISEAGEQIAEKFGLGKFKRQSGASGTDDEHATSSQIIAEMASKRAGSHA